MIGWHVRKKYQGDMDSIVICSKRMVYRVEKFERDGPYRIV
jgi:hypothetical protein